tara:strand:- start:62 stop:1042 length:981 start_codon:yes stop_codon:yes gene_type:complete
MRIIIFGFNKNVKKLIEFLIDAKYDILGIVPPIEQETFTYAENLKYGKEQKKIPLLKTKNINDSDFIKKIQNLNCDFYVNWGHSQIFSENLLNSSKLGCVNLHRGILPNARGFDPIFGERVNGVTTLGQTVHFMSTKIDQGKIINQRKFQIKKDLYRDEVDKIFQNNIVEFYFDSIKKVSNNENHVIIDSFGKYYPKYADGDEIINWHESSELILSKIKSLSPYKTHIAFLSQSYQPIHIVKAEKSEVENYYSTYGQIIDKDPKQGNLVKTGDNAIWINEIIFCDEKIIPSFPIGTTFVSNWLHEFMKLENRLSAIEKKINLHEDD